jgi:hypothetical protein
MTGIPVPLDADDGDVAWALQTAAVQWNRGARGDALVWLNRAIDAAFQAGQLARAGELRASANELAEQVAAEAEAVPSTTVLSDADDVDALLRDSRAPEIVVRSSFGSFDVDFDEAGSRPSAPGAAPAVPPAPAGPPGPPEPTMAARYAPEEVERLVASHPQPAPQIEIAVASVTAGSASSAPPPPLEPPLPSFDDATSVEPTLSSVEDSGELPRFPLDSEPEASGTITERQEPPTDETGGGSGGESSDFEPFEGPERPAPGEHVPRPGAPPPGLLVDGIPLADVRGLGDLPEEAQRVLVETARLETLAVEEELSFFAAALVTDGWVGVTPAVEERAGAYAGAGEVVFTRGTLAEGVALRVMAGEDDTVVAVWSEEDLERAIADCPWVADDLRQIADRYQALAGTAMGPLGERLDDDLRASVTGRMEVRALEPGEIIVERGKPVPGLVIVAGGHVELEPGEPPDLGPGDLLFPSEVLSAGPAPATARAASGGALVLRAERKIAHELLVSVPPLLEILAG